MNRILPIGSVVRIKDEEDPIMIFGYLQQTGLKPGVMVDYVGVPYPIGNINLQVQLGFQMTAIEEVLFEGYRNDDFKHIELLLGLRLVQYISEGKLQ